MTTGLRWFKSTHSGGEGGECVEVALEWRKSAEGDRVDVVAGPAAVYVRDSTDPSGPSLVFGPAAWSAFIAYVANAIV
jgi:Domain of unknown function (DUF397)